MPQPQTPAARDSATAGTVGLARAPDPGLIYDSPIGPLPVISKDGRQAWRVYARPFVAADDGKGARLGIIISDLGLNRAATQSVIEQLPATVTLAFTPYAPDLQAWIDRARAAGHEVLLQLPMEPFDYPENDPGPYTLLTNLRNEDNIERLEWVLSRGTGYIGVINHMGSKFTASVAKMRPIVDALRSRGLMLVDSRSSSSSTAAAAAREVGVPRALNNRFVDNVATRDEIDGQLVALEAIARRDGAALGVGFPYPVTVERVERWAQTLRAKGLQLAPASAIANLQPLP